MGFDEIDELDKFLFRKAKEINLSKYSSNKVYEIIDKAKRRKKIQIYQIAASLCIVLFSILILSKKYFVKNNNSNVDNPIISAENREKVFINIFSDNESGSYGQPTVEDLNELRDIVIVKIEPGLSYTNYDKIYDLHTKGDENYTFVRTIGKCKVLKSLKGDLKEGEIIEFRRKGGKLLYEEYIKSNISKPVNDNIAVQYKEYIKNGLENIWVSELNKVEIWLEEGKMYLVYLIKKSWGDYWITSGIQAVREYRQEDNTVLNNITGEFENIEEIIGE